jgi:hypothetical protein
MCSNRNRFNDECMAVNPRRRPDDFDSVPDWCPLEEDRWIPTDVRMPTVNERVLGVYQERDEGWQQWAIFTWHPKSGWWDEALDEPLGDDCEMVYWRPVPRLPEAEEATDAEGTVTNPLDWWCEADDLFKIGNELLAEVERLRSCLRECDVAIGGDGSDESLLGLVYTCGEGKAAMTEVARASGE